MIGTTTDRAEFPRPREVVRALLEEKCARFRQLKSSASGFRFGQGKEAQEEARRWRKEISRLKTELRSRTEGANQTATVCTRAGLAA